jgi:hypothetical protein
MGLEVSAHRASLSHSRPATELTQLKAALLFRLYNERSYAAAW